MSSKQNILIAVIILSLFSLLLFIVFGENGRGKTGIYRALMFALYGDMRLTQDSHVKADELHLVNLAELDANKDHATDQRRKRHL